MSSIRFNISSHSHRHRLGHCRTVNVLRRNKKRIQLSVNIASYRGGWAVLLDYANFYQLFLLSYFSRKSTMDEKDDEDDDDNDDDEGEDKEDDDN